MIGFGLYMYQNAAADASNIITFGFVGDIAPKKISKDTQPFLNVQDLHKSVDRLVGNFEGAVAEKGNKCYGGGRCFEILGNNNFVKAMKLSGVDVVNLANNHAMDAGEKGLKNTQNILTQEKILHSGIALSSTFETYKNITIGYVGFSPFKGTFPMLPDEVSAMVKKSEKKADITVAFFHGGAEGVEYQHVKNSDEFFYGSNRENIFASAHAAVDAGADIIIVSGPHVIRGAELYKGVPIFYSLGNYYGGDTFATGGILGESFFLTADYDIIEKKFTKFLMTPITLYGRVTKIADDATAQKIQKRYNNLSQADFKEPIIFQNFEYIIK